jgi:Rrf2 family protein
MLKISKTSKYALRGVIYLSKKRGSGFVKIIEISEQENIPLNYLRKIFQLLITNKIVLSSVGPRGGVKLPDLKMDTSTADIIRIFDGEPEINECTLFGTIGCPAITTCPIHDECSHMGINSWKKLENFKIDRFIKP